MSRTGGSRSQSPVLLRSGLAILGRPDLWATAILQLVRLAANGWWRRWPPLPAPDPHYLRFRLQTQYGDPDHKPEGDDVVSYLEWCRGLRRASR